MPLACRVTGSYAVVDFHFPICNCTAKEHRPRVAKNDEESAVAVTRPSKLRTPATAFFLTGGARDDFAARLRATFRNFDNAKADGIGVAGAAAW